jgi:hypothetical protein
MTMYKEKRVLLYFFVIVRFCSSVLEIKKKGCLLYFFVFSILMSNPCINKSFCFSNYKLRATKSQAPN